MSVKLDLAVAALKIEKQSSSHGDKSKLKSSIALRCSKLSASRF